MFGTSKSKTKTISQPTAGQANIDDIDDPLVNFNSTFGFSGVGIEDLQAAEFSLVGIAVDSSISISQFANDIENCLKTVVESLADSPRSDNLLLRVIRFDRVSKEIHGFQELPKCNLDKYDGALSNLGSSTCLYDATVDIVESITRYGEEVAKEHDVNGIVYIITDGDDRSSTYTVNTVKEKLKDGIGEDKLQSLTSILIGVNVDNPSMNRYLEDYANKAGFSKFIPIHKADRKTLADLADFIKRSTISVSKKINSPATSVDLKF